ncbi:MAG TPA: nucleotidyltransferase domain-containing protein [Nitrospirota bacterium]|nr:nucleotidyltransferase domain-containing protein [Nitrospirota bacterium]
MLTKLFSSTRAELLGLFFNNPDDKFYLREIARHIGKDAAGIKRELDNLVKMGLLAKEKRGVQKYYFANKSSPIFLEMKGLIFKTTGIQGAMKASLSRLKGVKSAFIYGSYAKGSEKEDSNINLMVIGQANITELNDMVMGLEEKLKREIDYLVFDEQEYRKRKESKDPFIRELLKGKKIFLVGKEDEL